MKLTKGQRDDLLKCVWDTIDSTYDDRSIDDHLRFTEAAGFWIMELIQDPLYVLNDCKAGEDPMAESKWNNIGVNEFGVAAIAFLRERINGVKALEDQAAKCIKKPQVEKWGPTKWGEMPTVINFMEQKENINEPH